jgi:hypothetical protein
MQPPVGLYSCDVNPLGRDVVVLPGTLSGIVELLKVTEKSILVLRDDGYVYKILPRDEISSSEVEISGIVTQSLSNHFPDNFVRCYGYLLYAELPRNLRLRRKAEVVKKAADVPVVVTPVPKCKCTTLFCPHGLSEQEKRAPQYRIKRPETPSSDGNDEELERQEHPKIGGYIFMAMDYVPMSLEDVHDAWDDFWPDFFVEMLCNIYLGRQVCAFSHNDLGAAGNVRFAECVNFNRYYELGDYIVTLRNSPCNPVVLDYELSTTAPDIINKRSDIGDFVGFIISCRLFQMGRDELSSTSSVSGSQDEDSDEYGGEDSPFSLELQDLYHTWRDAGRKRMNRDAPDFRPDSSDRPENVLDILTRPFFARYVKKRINV